MKLVLKSPLHGTVENKLGRRLESIDSGHTDSTQGISNPFTEGGRIPIKKTEDYPLRIY